MQDLRTKRSAHPDEALHYLLDAVSRSHAGRGIALVDERGRMLAGAGSPREMWSAVRAAQGKAKGEGFVSMPVDGAREPLRLTAFGRFSGGGMRRAAAGVARIWG
jgi:hypothetical protein